MITTKNWCITCKTLYNQTLQYSTCPHNLIREVDEAGGIIEEKKLSELKSIDEEAGKRFLAIGNPLVSEQEPPKEALGDVWLLVMKDMEDRRKGGIAKYGLPVQAFNGRDALTDCYQELLDACVYMRQAIEERKLSGK